MEVRLIRTLAILTLSFSMTVNGFAASHLIVEATDFRTTGGVRTLSLDDGRSLGAMPTHSDAIVRKFPQSPNLFVVNRLGQDNIQMISPDMARTLTQVSVGRASNPQDLALVTPDVAYVSRLTSKTLRKVNPHVMDRRTRQAVIYGEIDLSNPTGVDLSGAPDSDGLPEMTYLKLVGHHLLVQLQRIDERAGWVPSGKSLLAIVDTASDRVERYQLLQRPNPTTDFKTGADGAIYVGEAGWTGRNSKLDGGIERLDPTTLQSQGLVADEATLGGDIVDFEVISVDLVVAIVASPNTRLVAFSPSTGTRVLLDPGAYTLSQLALDRARGRLYVADRDPRQPRVRVFDARSLVESAPGWTLDLPPFQMVLAD